MLTQRATFPSPTIPFRVVGRPGEVSAETNGPSLDWTVRQFVNGYVMPNYLKAKKRDAKTVTLYYQTVDLWEEFMAPENPPLRRIEQEPSLCQNWVEEVKKRPGRKSKYVADNTVRKYCTHFQKILDLAGPRTRKTRNAAQLFIDPPYLERPELVQQSPQNDFTLEEIGLWLGACRHAAKTRVIRRCRPEAFCRNLILFIYNTSLRIESVLLAEENMIGRKRENWITIPPTIYKGKKWGGDFYLNRHARAALDAVRVPGDKRLFPWHSDQNYLHKYMGRILAQSEIPEHRYFNNHFHGLRSTVLTWLNARNPMVAKIVGGHRTGDVQQNHYCNPRIVVDELEQIPQPKPIEPELQRTLF